MNRNPSATRIDDILKLLPRNFLSLTVFKWTLPISLGLAVIITPVEINSAQEVMKWLFIGFCGHMSMLPFVYYGREKNFNEQVLLVLLAGFTRGAVGGILAPLFDVQDTLSLPTRTANSMMAVFYWNIAGAVIVEYGVEFRAKLRVLLNEILEKNITGLSDAAKKSSNHIVEIIGTLEEKIIATVGSAPTREKLQEASREIDALINNYIKPLSQSRWNDGELIWARAGFLAVLKRTLSLNAIPVVAVILLTWPFTLLVQLTRIGLVQTIIVQITWIPIVLVMTKVIYRGNLIRGKLLGKNLQFLLLLLIPYLITYFVQRATQGDGLQEPSTMISGYLLSAVTQITFYIIGALLLALRNDQEFVFEFIGDVIKAGELEKLLERTKPGNVDGNYAQYLHAEVQSQLLACKLLLLKAAESDFELFPPEITRQIVERMDKLKQPYERPSARIPSKRIEALQQSWAGLAEISYHFSDDFSELHSYSDICSQLIEEAVVNSIRHGKANKIQVTGIKEADYLSIEVIDNGQFSESSRHSGLGSILFNTFARDWSLRREPEATVLSFTIEVSNQGSSN
jgi:hypothetical protein